MSSAQTNLRILCLDAAAGGALIGLVQIKIIRALMRNIWKLKNHTDPSESDIDDMRPCDYFDWIFGSGTGGIIAVYLGRLHLTLRQCEEFYNQLGREVYSQPFSHWNLYQTCKYDHKSLERVLKQQTKAFLEPDETAVRFFCPPGSTEKCKAAVMTKMAEYATASHILRSDRESGEVWEVVRATTASYFDFPNVQVGSSMVLYGPEAGACNPALEAWNRMAKDYGHHEPKPRLCLVSIGSGITSELELDMSVGPMDIFRGLFGQATRAPPVKTLAAMAKGCETTHQQITKKLNRKNKKNDVDQHFSWDNSGYFRLNFKPYREPEDSETASASGISLYATADTVREGIRWSLGYLMGPCWSLVNLWTGRGNPDRWIETKSLAEKMAYAYLGAGAGDNVQPTKDLTAAAELIFNMTSVTE